MPGKISEWKGPAPQTFYYVPNWRGIWPDLENRNWHAVLYVIIDMGLTRKWQAVSFVIIDMGLTRKWQAVSYVIINMGLTRKWQAVSYVIIDMGLTRKWQAVSYVIIDMGGNTVEKVFTQTASMQWIYISIHLDNKSDILLLLPCIWVKTFGIFSTDHKKVSRYGC